MKQRAHFGLGCSGLFVAGLLGMAVVALSFALLGMTTVAMTASFSMILTQLAAIGLGAATLGSIGTALALRNPLVKQIVAKKFDLPEPKIEAPKIPSIPTSRPIQAQRLSRARRMMLPPQIVEHWFDDED